MSAEKARLPAETQLTLHGAAQNGTGLSDASSVSDANDADIPELTLIDHDEGAPRLTRESFEITAEIKIGTRSIPDPMSPIASPESSSPTSEASNKIAPGGHLGPYDLINQIGEGGMATIFRAKDTRDGRIVVLKILHPHQAQSLAGDRFRREYRAIHRLPHPSIVQVYDFGEQLGQPYIVMEYVEGHDLKQHLKTLRALPLERRWREVEAILIQTCQALAFIHERGVVHRDLKPSNILLTKDNRVKLTDFGVARDDKNSVQLTQAGMLVGTLAYLAPEVFEQTVIDHRVDLYALGVVLYVLLTDKLPFSGKNIAQIMQKHLTQTPEPPSRLNPAIPEHLERITLRLLNKDPVGRYASASEILRELEAVRQAAEADPEVEETGGDQQWLPRLVGRAPALHMLRTAIAGLAKGTGGIVAVEGVEGSGKSRIVEAALGFAVAHGIVVYSGRCLAGGQSWAEGFRRIVEAMAVDVNAGTQRPEAIDALRRHFGMQDRPAPASAPGHSVPGIEEYLVNSFASRLQHPCVVWLDDVDWADPGTLNAITLLTRRLIRAGAPLLLVLTMKPRGPSQPFALQQLLSGDSAGVRPRQVLLTPLQINDVHLMFQAIYKDDPRVGPLAARLHHVCGGNPLLIVESARYLMAQGRMAIRRVRGEKRWVLSLTAEEIGQSLHWPRSLKALLLSRLSAYPTQTRTLLRLVAVWGRELRFKTLMRLASASEDAISSHIDRLMVDGWLSEDWVGGEEGYVLAHPSYRAVLLSELTEVDLRRLRGFIDNRLGLAR